MICKACNKEFVSRRKDAIYCSAKCRVSAHRVTDNVTDNLVTDKSVTDNVTDNVSVPVTDNTRYKSPLACKVLTCYGLAMPGHGDMCIYHWRKSSGLSTISIEDYRLNNAKVS